VALFCVGMATLFISYTQADTQAARRLEQALLAKGHRVPIRVGAAVAGNWRTQFIRGLVAAEVFVAVISEATASRATVVGEIGAARAMDQTRGMLILPVLCGDIGYPDYINDLYCFKMEQDTDQAASAVADQLHVAMIDNVKLAPRIFVSHRHKDRPIASELVLLLEQAFEIGTSDLRCTSVKPYVLTPGERTSERLRTDISRAELVIGVLTPDTSESNYVLCELGASWGRDVTTFPVLAKGATISNVPSPLNERHSVSLENESDCLDLIEYVAAKTTLRRKEGSPGRLSEQAARLAQVARLA
jgi:TIR domain